MSKKHKKSASNQVISPVALAHKAEYRIIKHDLFKVVVLNAVYLAGLLAVYYTNTKSGYLDRWFETILHF